MATKTLLHMLSAKCNRDNKHLALGTRAKEKNKKIAFDEDAGDAGRSMVDRTWGGGDVGTCGTGAVSNCCGGAELVAFTGCKGHKKTTTGEQAELGDPRL